MKKILFTMIVASMLIIPMSCDKSLDINTNPLRASSADPNAVLPFVLLQFSNRNVTELGTRINDVYGTASATFNSPKQGPTTEFLTGNTWNMLYVQVLGNLSLVERDAREAGESRNSITAIALIMKAYAFLELTSIWEDVPFEEALNAEEFPTPRFNTQEEVLRGIIPFLTEAVNLIDAIPTSGAFALTGDLLYGGEMDNWKRFANSLQVRILMMIRNRDASVETQINNLLNNADLIEDDSQAALFTYPGTPGNDNAYFQLVTAFGTGSNETYELWGPTPLIRNLLEGDPRLELWCVDGSLGGYAPQPVGNFPDGSSAKYSDNVIRKDLPDIWFLPAEISFYRAELLAASGSTVSAAANTQYKKGVTQALTFWGQDIPGALQSLSTSEITSFVSSLPSIEGMDSADALTAIGNQQYLSYFWMPMDTWTHVRRTDVPHVAPAPGSSITTMLKRFTYPPAERGSNTNTPVDKLTDVKQWFEN